MSNDFKPFCTGGGANALSAAAWSALAATLLQNGFQAGVASAQQVNTALRQALAGSNLLGNFINDQGFNALDDGNTAALLAAFKSALTNLLALKAGSTGQVFQAADGSTGKQVVNISQFELFVGASSGYARVPVPGFPAGLILQWGRVNLPTGNGDVVNLPIPFPNVIMNVIASDWGNGANSTGWAANGSSKSSFLGYGRVVTLTNSPYSSTALGYLAVGN